MRFWCPGKRTPIFLMSLEISRGEKIKYKDYWGGKSLKRVQVGTGFGGGGASPRDGSSPEHPLGADPVPPPLPAFGGPTTAASPHNWAIPRRLKAGHSSSRPLRPDPGQGMSNFILSPWANNANATEAVSFPSTSLSPWELEGMVWGHQGDSMGMVWGHHGNIKGTAWGDHRDSMRIPWGQHGDTMGTAWGQHGDTTGTV